MIKNYDIVKKVESQYFSRLVIQPPEECLRRVGEMYEFSMKYGYKADVPVEKSEHVVSLIKRSMLFLLLKERDS